MSSLPVAACLPQSSYRGSGVFRRQPEKSSLFRVADFMQSVVNDISDKAVAVEGDSALLDPKYMKQGQYYSVVIHERPYLYRKVNDDEIEVYGLAEDS